MYKSRKLLLVLFLFVTFCSIKAQTFTITSPTSDQIIPMPLNTSQIVIQLGFTWYGVPPFYVDLIRVDLNGTNILDLNPSDPANPPSHINLTLSPGNHTLDVGVRFYFYVNGELRYEAAYRSVSFHIVNNLTIQNLFSDGFNGGTININSEQKTSPYRNTYLVGETVNLGAEDQPHGDYYNVWNQSGTYNSRWEKKLYGGSYSQIQGGTPRNYPYSVSTADNSAEIQGVLRKRYNISRDDDFTEFDGTVSAGVVSQIVEQNSGQISAPTTQTINGKSYNFSYWNDNLSYNNPRALNPTNNEEYTAVYKYINHANTTNAFGSNSQKKIVRTTDGYLHKVYESMNKVWYEWSTNNGASWVIRNNGKPLSGNDAKLPSIDYSGGTVFITWQEKYDFGGIETFKIRLAYIQQPYGYLAFYDVADGFSESTQIPYTFNAAPVIAWSSNDSRVIVAWSLYGINYRYGLLNPYETLSWYTNVLWIEGTTSNSTNPTIAVRKDGGTTVFHLAWQHGTSAIK
jgi:hypothetical protein